MLSTTPHNGSDAGRAAAPVGRRLPLKFLFLLPALACCCSLSGCFIPETFTASVAIDTAGGYHFSFAGDVIYLPALENLARGKLSRQMSGEITGKADRLIRSGNGVTSAEYQGNGRYRIVAEKRGRTGEAYSFPWEEVSFLKITYQQDGTIMITTPALTRQDLQRLNKMGARLAGSLTVAVPRGAHIIDHNADSSPKLFGLIGDYTWHINAPDRNFYIIIQPPS